VGDVSNEIKQTQPVEKFAVKRRYRVTIDLEPEQLEEMIAELEAVAEHRVDYPKLHLSQLYATLKQVAEGSE
jgi:hypothetical protein